MKKKGYKTKMKRLKNQLEGYKDNPKLYNNTRLKIKTLENTTNKN